MIVKRAVEKAKPRLEIERLLSKTLNALKDRKRSAILPGVFSFCAHEENFDKKIHLFEKMFLIFVRALCIII